MSEPPSKKRWMSNGEDMMSPPSKHLASTSAPPAAAVATHSQTKKARRIRHVSIQVPKNQLEQVKQEIEAGTFDVNRFAQSSSLVVSGPFKGQQAGGVRARVVNARVTPEVPELTLPFQSDLRPPQNVTQVLCHRRSLVQQLLAARNERNVYAAMGAFKKAKPESAPYDPMAGSAPYDPAAGSAP